MNVNDFELIQDCVSGKKEAWDAFVDKFTRLIYDSILRTFIKYGSPILKETVCDVHQDVFLTILDQQCKALRVFEARNNCQLSSYLRTIAVRKTIDHLRKIRPSFSLNSPMYEKECFLPELTTFDAHDTLMEEENIQVTQSLLTDLREDERRLCEMFYFEHHSSKFIAQELGITLDHFYVIKQRVLTKLKKLALEKKIVES